MKFMIWTGKISILSDENFVVKSTFYDGCWTMKRHNKQYKIEYVMSWTEKQHRKEHVYNVTAMLNVPKDNKTNKTNNFFLTFYFS